MSLSGTSEITRTRQPKALSNYPFHPADHLKGLQDLQGSRKKTKQKTLSSYREPKTLHFWLPLPFRQGDL